RSSAARWSARGSRSFGIIPTRPRSSWATPARSRWAGSSGSSRSWCSSRSRSSSSAASLSGRRGPLSSRWAGSNTPGAAVRRARGSASSSWRRSTIISKNWAGPRRRWCCVSGCSRSCARWPGSARSNPADMPLTPPAFLQPLLAQPVAILGGGVSGDGARALLAALGATGHVYDVKGTEFTAKAASGHLLAVYSPGFEPGHPWLARARTAGLECLAELDFAALCWRGRVVAVTGTNGKTTLTEFLTHALRLSGRAAWATGNIGHAFSQLVVETAGGVKDAVAICEVSSFQAEALRHLQPDATLWTNFAEDHLERHPGLEAYFSAKWNLVARTTPGGVLAGSSVVRYAAKFDRPLAATAGVPSEGQPADPRLAGTVFADYPQRENFLLAAAWWRA